MKNKMLKTLTALFGGTAMMLIASPALAVPALTDASAFIKLDWIDRDPVAGGGGVSEFQIDAYAGTPLVTLGAIDDSVYATCIEQGEYLRTGSEWYAVYTPGIAGMPSATEDINFLEEDVIRNILGSRFGEDFTLPGASTVRSTTDVRALQSILWEAGQTGTGDGEDDFSDGDIEGGARNTDGGEALAEDWLDDWLTNGLDPDAKFVTLFTLVSVDLLSSSTGKEVAALGASDFKIVSGQDFLTYEQAGAPVPVPAPLTLMGLALFGLAYKARARKATA